MFNLLKIDFYNTRIENNTPTDYSSDITNPSQNFEGILKDQLQGITKTDKREKESTERSALSSDEKIKDEKIKIDEDTPSKESKRNNEKRTDDISKDGNKPAPIKDDVQLIKDEEILSKGNTPLIANCFNILLNIFKDLQNLPENEGYLKDFKAVLLKLHDYLNGKRPSENDINDIFSKLKSLLKRFENGKFIPSPQYEAKRNLPKLKDEIAFLIDTIKRHVSKLNNASTHIKGFESELNEIKNSTGERIRIFNETLNNREASTLMEKHESPMAFQFFNRGGIPRGNILSSISYKNNHFNEQLQSIIQNAKVFVRDNRNGSFSIRLYPESLGRINVNLGLDKGIISGKFLVDTIETRELLVENISAIKEKLEEAGMSVGEFNVNVRGESEGWEYRIQEEDSAMKGEHNININNDYDINSTYIHDGEIDMII